MWRRIFAIFIARNREFYRDKAGLGWNILMPAMMILAFAFIFDADDEQVLTVGVIGAPPPDSVAERFIAMRGLRPLPVDDRAAAIAKIGRHQLDLLLDARAAPPVYWINANSAKGALAEQLLLGGAAQVASTRAVGDGPLPRRATVSGTALPYAHWVMPGVLAMNVMFSSLWGVGWVVVRYRKNGVLRRLKATPLSPLEFLAAQILSRLIVVLAASALVFAGASLMLDLPMRGSYLALALVYAAGALCMISVGLAVSARLRTEELADGILNLLSWPMLLLSGVWFSMEGTSATAQALSRLMPLTHLVEAARAIMIDGAGLGAVLPGIALLLGIAALLIAIATWLFRWE